MTDSGDRPAPPDVPDYVRDPLERQSPERLDAIAAYARELAAWKRERKERAAEARREADGIGEDDRRELRERDVSVDPADYERVPNEGAYVTIKETKPGYRYYYWQWRDGDSWKNEYIAPVDRSGEGAG